MPTSRVKPRRQRAVKWLAAGGLLAAIGVGYLLLPGCEQDGNPGTDFRAIPTVAVRRGKLTITVTKGGTLQARESLPIDSKVDGNHKILTVIPEGTIITQKDVEEGRVLVELDVTDLAERETNQDISSRNAEAAHTQAQENLAIQEKDNESNIAAALLEVKFTQMELERYLGDTLAARAMESEVDFATLLDNEDELGGQAKQELRKREADVTVATMELARATEKLDGTNRLKEKGYKSESEYQADELNKTRREIDEERAKKEEFLFRRYTLPKEAEQRYSDWVEAKRDLEKAEARARSELAQAKANLDSRRVAYERERDRLEKTRQMIKDAVMRATKPGLVVYASTTNRWRRDNPVREGADISRGQSIITLPDLNTLAARVNIHETDIGKIELDQPARVTLDAVAGEVFTATVVSKAPMASAEHRWRSPDVRVYETDVALDLDNLPEGVELKDLTPGMSATAEILIAELEDVLFIPIQCVTTYKGERVCWVATAGGPELRTIVTGHFTNKYVVVEGNLEEGEEVYLAPPEELKDEGEEGEEKDVDEPRFARPEQQKRPEDAASAGKVDIEALKKELEGLSPEERIKKMREVLPKLSEEDRRKLRGGSGRGRPGGRPPRGSADTANSP